MAVYNKFNDFVSQCAKGTHQIFTGTAQVFKVMLTNTAPVATNAVKTDITEIAAGNGYVAGGNATTVTASNTAGTLTVQGTQVIVTAAGGTVGPFRYAVLYNDTAASKNLIAWWDYGSSITLNDTEPLTLKFNNTTPGNMFTLV